MIYHLFKRYLQFIVSKRKTVISSPARSCFFLQSQIATFTLIHYYVKITFIICFTLQQGDNLSPSLI